MTRIVAGDAGGLTLSVPDSGTRPTSDRVREAIFSTLDALFDFDDARVADLFAGSGALGLEAVSRGASLVTLVDKSPVAAGLCARNGRVVAAACESTGRAVVVESIPQGVDAFLAQSGAREYDLVFLDPPYDLDNGSLEHSLRLVSAVIHADSVVVVERSSRDAEPSWPSPLRVERTKTYGETIVYFLEVEATASLRRHAGDPSHR